MKRKEKTITTVKNKKFSSCLYEKKKKYKRNQKKQGKTNARSFSYQINVVLFHVKYKTDQISSIQTRESVIL